MCKVASLTSQMGRLVYVPSRYGRLVSTYTVVVRVSGTVGERERKKEKRERERERERERDLWGGYRYSDNLEVLVISAFDTIHS